MEIPEKTGKELERNPDGTIKEGSASLNPNGRPKGKKNFETIFREALEQVALANNKTPKQTEIDIINKGIMKALDGNFYFWDSLLNRLHGKPVNKIGLDDELDELEIKIIRTKDEIPDVINNSLSENA